MATCIHFLTTFLVLLWTHNTCFAEPCNAGVAIGGQDWRNISSLMNPFVKSFIYIYISGNVEELLDRIHFFVLNGALNNSFQNAKLVVSVDNMSSFDKIENLLKVILKVEISPKIETLLLRFTEEQLRNGTLLRQIISTKNTMQLKQASFTLGLTMKPNDYQIILEKDFFKYIDVIEIEVPGFTEFFNYQLFVNHLKTINHNVVDVSAIKVWISVSLEYKTYVFGPNFQGNKFDGVARYAITMQQISTKYSIENKVGVILRDAFNWENFEKLRMQPQCTSLGNLQYESDLSIRLSWNHHTGYLLKNFHVSNLAITTALEMVGKQYRRVIVDAEAFINFGNFCHFAGNFSQEMWLIVSIKNERESHMLAFILRSIIRGDETFMCVTGVIITPEDLLVLIKIEHRYYPRKMSAIIEDFQSSIKVANISLILDLLPDTDKASPADKMRHLLEPREPPSVWQQIFNISNYFLWQEVIRMKYPLDEVFFANIFNKLLFMLEQFEEVKRSFPSIIPVFSPKLAWFHEETPKACESKQNFNSFDVLDAIRSLMYVFKTPMYEDQFVNFENSFQILYGRWELLIGTTMENNKIYTPSESVPCVKWSPNGNNRTTISSKIWGISVRASNFEELGYHQNGDLNLASILVLHKFQTVELVVDLKNLQSTCESLLTAAAETKSPYKLLISLNDAIQEFNQSEILEYLETKTILLTDKYHVHGFHIPIDLESNEIFAETDVIKKMAGTLQKRNISFGMLLNNCGKIVNYAFADRVIIKLELVDYLVCDIPSSYPSYKINSENGANFFEISQIVNIARLLEWKLDKDFKLNATVILRIGWPKNPKISEKENSHEFIQFVSLVNDICNAYQISFLIYDAFDTNNTIYNGWWRIENEMGPLQTVMLTERESESLGVETWRPPANNQHEYITFLQRNIFLVIPLVFTLTLVILICTVVAAKRYLLPNNVLLTEEEIKQFFEEGTATEFETENLALYIGLKLKYDKKFELALSEIHIDKKSMLGSGNFGTVYKGNFTNKRRECELAVKVPIPGSKEALKSILCEIKVMSYIGNHTNVLTLVGACTEDIRKGNVYVFTEYCANGTLLAYLQSKTQLLNDSNWDLNETLQQMCQFGKGVAAGMEYISSKNVVHGDLSARNILLDETLVCKISDFGLSTKLYNSAYAKKKLAYIPWRWMAIESLDKMQFSSKSDVWSFGIILWEIYSLGAVPYSGLNWCADFVNKLSEGLRLPKPKFATDYLYKEMRKCWKSNSTERPDFKKLSLMLEEVEISLGKTETSRV